MPPASLPGSAPGAPSPAARQPACAPSLPSQTPQCAKGPRLVTAGRAWAPGRMRRLIVVGVADPEWESESTPGALADCGGFPLTGLGHQQAKISPRCSGSAEVIVRSPYRRAQQTAPPTIAGTPGRHARKPSRRSISGPSTGARPRRIARARGPGVRGARRAAAR